MSKNLIPGQLYKIAAIYPGGKLAFFDIDFLENSNAKFTTHDSLIGVFIKKYKTYQFIFLVENKLGLVVIENSMVKEIK